MKKMISYLKKYFRKKYVFKSLQTTVSNYIFSNFIDENDNIIRGTLDTNFFFTYYFKSFNIKIDDIEEITIHVHRKNNNNSKLLRLRWEESITRGEYYSIRINNTTIWINLCSEFISKYYNHAPAYIYLDIQILLR